MNVEIGGFKRKGWVTLTLEHLDNPFAVMCEIHRICKHGSTIEIEVPYWKNDMFTNPVHKHYFKPQWFSSLTPKSRKFRNMESWCPCDFVVLDTKWVRGKHAFWRKYSLHIILKINKIRIIG
jgi:hypothetical protein